MHDDFLVKHTKTEFGNLKPGSKSVIFDPIFWFSNSGLMCWSKKSVVHFWKIFIVQNENEL